MSDFSSDFKRLKRLAKSVVPRFSKDTSASYYRLEDAKHMINELGMQMPPDVLEKLLENEMILDDFLSSIVELENVVGERVTTEFKSIDMDFIPRVYVEENLVGFSVTIDDEEIVFAEYTLKK